jgi:glyoxylase-like metal-dependent hydrolase (beta-lactamase superfamily II)/ferredoxin
LRRAENICGDFYVDSTCIDCDLCRAIAPAVFAQAGEQSAVRSQPVTETDVAASLRALVACPVGAIGTTLRHDFRPARDAFPEQIEAEVYFCGYASPASFGASSYLVLRPQGNVLVDSPRFATQLVRRIEALGGVRTLFLTHQDDVADHAKWSAHFGAERILHRADYHPSFGAIERLLEGEAQIPLDPDLVAIPVPGHTPGSTALLVRNRFLFSGDHLWWSPTMQRLHASRGVCWHSWSDQLRSIERLLAYRFAWVLPGHGRRFHAAEDEMPARLRACIAALQARTSRRRPATEDGAS